MVLPRFALQVGCAGLDPYYYRDILRTVKGAVPDMHAHAFSPMEMTYGTELTGMSLHDYLQMLKDNGLDTLPGTAAEVLDDDVRHMLSRKKVTVKQWTNVVRTAHKLGIPTTSTMMYGHLETPEHWINQFILLRDIQKETGGFTEFVPLGFVHANTGSLPTRHGTARPHRRRERQNARPGPVSCYGAGSTTFRFRGSSWAASFLSRSCRLANQTTTAAR